MPFSHGSVAKLFVGGYQLTGFLTSVSAPADRDMAESSVLGLTDKTYIPGLLGGTFPFEGLFDGTALALDEILAAALADVVGKAVTYLPAGDALSARARLGRGYQAAYEITTPVDGIAAVSGEIQVSGGPDGGLVIHPLTQRTTTGNGTDVDHGALTTFGASAVLQVTQYATLTNAVIKVQHSVDGSAWVDLITFATVTGANVSERLTVAGTVNRHIRATWTLTGAGSITFHVGFARKLST